MTALPVLFVAHGSPMLALDKEKGADYKRWADAIDPPKSVLIMSAHWPTRSLLLGTTTRRELVYDFSGFPDKLYKIVYPAARAPYLAQKVKQLLSGFKVGQMESRGLDHGVWVPLYHMFPSAGVPVLQLSLPIGETPENLFKIGQALSSLRNEGILIVGSGVLVHNLGRMQTDGGAAEDWAIAFENWVRGALDNWQIDTLLNFQKAPYFRAAHPTEEHFLPLIFAAGAASGPNASTPKISYPVSGFEFGSLSRLCVQFD